MSFFFFSLLFACFRSALAVLARSSFRYGEVVAIFPACVSFFLFAFPSLCVGGACARVACLCLWRFWPAWRSFRCTREGPEGKSFHLFSTCHRTGPCPPAHPLFLLRRFRFPLSAPRFFFLFLSRAVYRFYSLLISRYFFFHLPLCQFRFLVSYLIFFFGLFSIYVSCL